MNPLRIAELFLYSTVMFFIIMAATGFDVADALHRAVASVNITLAKLAVVAAVMAVFPTLGMRHVRVSMLVACLIASCVILSTSAWWIPVAAGAALVALARITSKKQPA